MKNQEREDQIQAASEKISEVMNQELYNGFTKDKKGLTVYNSICTRLGIESDNDSDVWIEIERYMVCSLIAEKLIEMSMEECEMCGDEMTKEEHDFSDICPECRESASEIIDTTEDEDEIEYFFEDDTSVTVSASGEVTDMDGMMTVPEDKKKAIEELRGSNIIT